MFTDNFVAGTKVNALVDTDPSHLFISDFVANKLGLKVEKAGGWLKTINSKEIPTVGCRPRSEREPSHRCVACKKTLKVIILDEYEFVIGIDFLDQVNALIVPSGNHLYIADGTS